jgi:hypothetical protein
MFIFRFVQVIATFDEDSADVSVKPKKDVTPGQLFVQQDL